MFKAIAVYKCDYEVPTTTEEVKAILVDQGMIKEEDNIKVHAITNSFTYEKINIEYDIIEEELDWEELEN